MVDVRDEYYMKEALLLARHAMLHQEVPVGAVLVLDDKIVGRGWNCPIRTCDPTAHAEIQALRDAAQSCQNYRLPQTTLYVTIEPCVMCVGAMLHARVQRVVFGATEPKAGALQSNVNLLDQYHWNHQISYAGGVLQPEASDLMQQFFKMRRERKKELKRAARIEPEARGTSRKLADQ